MSSLLSGWLIRLTGAALIASAAVTLAPDGPAKKALRLVCGVMMMIALMSGAADFDYSAYAARFSEYRQQAQTLIDGTENSGTQLVRSVIEAELESYILDKAEACGVSDAEVAVSARWSSDGYWYPDTVTIAGQFDEQTRREISRYITAELGVQEIDQRWECSADENE